MSRYEFLRDFKTLAALYQVQPEAAAVPCATAASLLLLWTLSVCPPSLVNANLQPSANLEGKINESLLTGYLTDRLTLGNEVSFCFYVI